MNNYGSLTPFTGPVTRVGVHKVTVHDAEAVRQVMRGDVKIVDEWQGRTTSVVSRAHMVVQGCRIPAGTLIVLDESV